MISWLFFPQRSTLEGGASVLKLFFGQEKPGCYWPGPWALWVWSAGKHHAICSTSDCWLYILRLPDDGRCGMIRVGIKRTGRQQCILVNPGKSTRMKTSPGWIVLWSRWFLSCIYKIIHTEITENIILITQKPATGRAQSNQLNLWFCGFHGPTDQHAGSWPEDRPLRLGQVLQLIDELLLVFAVTDYVSYSFAVDQSFLRELGNFLDAASCGTWSWFSTCSLSHMPIANSYLHRCGLRVCRGFDANTSSSRCSCASTCACPTQSSPSCTSWRPNPGSDTSCDGRSSSLSVTVHHT